MNLHDLLDDAVADIEPTDRLADLRARTASPARAAARPWFWAAGATVLATAAAVTVVAVLGDNSAAPDHHHDHHDMVMNPPASTQLVPAYFIGATPDGDRLYREFDEVPVGDPLQAALDRIQRAPSDPDYSTAWPAGSLESATLGDGTIDVELGPVDLDVPDPHLAEQQVVQTLQGALGEQLPVRFLHNGVETNGSTVADPGVLNPVSISDPVEGNAYESSMIARGRANVLERHVNWRLADGSGSVVRRGVAILGEKDGFKPWETSVDLTGLEPGTYVFTVTSDDEAFTVPSTDTRTIIVR